MPRTTTTSVQCPNCGHVNNTIVDMVIDATNDPEAKMRLLTGRANQIQCANCGADLVVASPLVYHDSEKELLIEMVPMELNLPKEQSEKILGDLMQEVIRSLPQEGRKGYLFQPRRALTMQGLIDQVLEADGVTPEMMDEQRARVQFVEKLLQATDETQLDAIIEENDEKIDLQLLQTMAFMAQQMLAQGREDVGIAILDLQQYVAEKSTVGKELLARGERQEQIIAEVAQKLKTFGTPPDTDKVIDLALEYAGQEEYLQAIAGLVRPLLDESFFQELSMKVAQAPASERDNLSSVADDLKQFVALIDQQAQSAMQSAAQFLQAILSSPNPEEVIQQNAALIDDTFMAVLSANIQEAQRRGDVNAAARLKQVYDAVVNVLQSNMEPELAFINDLLSAPTEDDARQLLEERGASFGADLLDILDGVDEMLQQRGGSDDAKKRVAFLKQEAAQVLT